MTPDAGILTQLRAFEAVGRHLSFTRAAEELFVTPAALSHHVRHLENALGVTLLERLHRRIELTSAGTQLLPECTHAFKILTRALAEAGRSDDSLPLTVSVAPYFSARWITPRLSRFWSRSPGVELQLHHAYQPANFLTDNLDAGINWCPGDWPNADTTLVLHGRLTMICRPDLLGERDDLHPRDLLSHRLLYEFDIEHLRAWFRLAGVDVSSFERAEKVDDSHTLRQLVLDGHGVGLFFSGLIKEDVRSGLLEAPFDVEVDPGSAYYLVCPKGRPVSARLRAFIDWLLTESATDPYA